MPHPQGELFYPGINAVISADIARGHGISPNPITITITPQRRKPNRTGTLVLRYGSKKVTIPDCIVDQAQYRYDQNGQLVQLVLLDRRWKWKYNFEKKKAEKGSNNKAETMSGKYNTRLPHGPVEIVDPATKEDNRTLMKMCLAAMGEKNYIIAPNIFTRYDEIYWDNVPPAQALQELCDQAGARIVLRLDNRILITKAGRRLDGTPGRLPDGAIIFDNTGANPPEAPDIIQLVCGSTRYQGDFFCEAVGDDVDGLVKPIADLSYKPPDGWETGDFLHFTDVPRIQAGTALSQWRSYVSPRDLAKASVLRKYRISLKSFTLPGHPDKAGITELRQLLPIGQQLIEPTFDKKTGWFRPLETIVWGCYAYDHRNNIEMPQALDADGKDLPLWKFKPEMVIPSKNPITGAEERTKETTVIANEDYDLDSDTGIITFRNIMYRYGDVDTTRQHMPAIIWLRCGVCVNDQKTRAPQRHYEQIELVSTGSKPRLVHQIFDETLFVRHVPTYSPGRPDSVTGSKSNLKTVQEQANIRLQAEAAKFQNLAPQMRTYAGWDNFDVDGAVHQVCYHLGTDGKATMSVCLNDELTILTMPYNERRFYEKMRAEENELQGMLQLIREQNLPFSQLSNIGRRGR